MNEFEKMEKEIRAAEIKAAEEKIWQEYLALPEDQKIYFGDQG